MNNGKKEKEGHMIDPIVEIILTSTMKEYYESIDSKNKPTLNNKIDEKKKLTEPHIFGGGNVSSFLFLANLSRSLFQHNT
ncbi:MAG: hypothetical protein ACRDE7_01665, partial [Sphingobacterium sp.]